MAEFHFLRPWWLLALPFGVLLILQLFRLQASGGGWRRVVDRSLQPLVLTADAYGGRRWPLAAALAAWAVATLALAGPAWERLPVPAFRSDEALVVALDLSRSMDAADLSPSRLARAKLKLLSLLEHRTGGQTGLVVFSAHAFTVTPLTTDTRTIGALVASLSSDIMPSRGSRIEAGLDKAAALLRQANVSAGRILLITDALPSTAAIASARELRGEGIEISVLGVGTEDGAPIPERDGGFLTDRSGNVVVPKLDTRSLSRLAEAGGGRFSPLTASDADLERLVPQEAAGDLAAASETDTQLADTWRDAGLVFALLLLPLVAFGFRRGWIALWICCLLLPAPEVLAQADNGGPDAAARGAAPEGGGEGGFSLRDGWRSLWLRPDQRAAEALAEERPERAARLFEDPEWRAAARYRAGEFEASAETLAGIDTADAHYNRGNALARAGEVAPAIAAYDRALELDPDHADARHNRELLEELLEQNPMPQQAASSEEQNQNGEEQDSGQSEGRQSAGESDRSDGGDPGDGDPQQAQGSPEGETSPDRQGEASEQEQLASADSESARDGEESESEPGPAEREPREGEADGEAPGADELEQWASDQAAEQWLRRIEQDPGGLLRRKFLYQYQRLGIDQDGNYVWPGDEGEPW